MRGKLVWLLLTLVLLTGLASAAITVKTPGASAVLGGGSVGLNATGITLANCTFYAKSASTGNISWTSLNGTFKNESADNNSVYGVFDSAILEDSNDYVFNATCKYINNSIDDGTRSGISIDNGVPTAPSSLSPASNILVTTSGTQTFSSTVTNAQTTGCTYTISRGGTPTGGTDVVSGTATYDTSTCSFTKAFSTSSDNGLWYWSVTASDGTNTTVSATNIMNMQLVGAGSGGFVIEGEASTQASTPLSTTTIVLIGAGILVVYLLFKKKK